VGVGGVGSVTADMLTRFVHGEKSL